MPTIRDLLKAKGSEVITAPPDLTLSEAVEELVRHGIGSLLIAEAEDRVLGILTERDLLRVVRDRTGEWRSRTVGEHMTTDIVCGVPDDDLDYVMSRMTSNRFRHLPVVEEGRLVGIVSIGDVVKALMSAREYENRQLRDYIGGGYR